MTTTRALRPVFAAALSLASLAPLPTAAAAAPFDGIWSVQILTDAGDCDRGYRYRIEIVGGQVRYAPADGGGADFQVTGRVTPAGAIRVSVARGDQRATGVGRLVGTRGAGTWKGGSATRQCSGRWDAERRG